MNDKHAAKKRLSAMFSALLALVLAFTLMGPIASVGGSALGAASIAPQQAVAEDTFQVQLTIIDKSTDPETVLCNEVVSGLSSSSTVADLLTAAGYTAGTQAESASNSSVYFEQYGAPYFEGKGSEQVDGTWLWWSTGYANGADSDYNKAMLSSSLVSGGHYQYIYGDGSAFAYSDAVPDLLSSSSDDPGKDDPGTPVALFAASSSDIQTLVGNLAANYSEGGANAALTDDHPTANNRYNAAIALNALGKGSSVDKGAVLDSIAKTENIGAGLMGKYITMLTAAGVDCTNVTIDGVQRNLVAEMESAETGSEGVTDLVCILPVYSANGYTVQTDGAPTAQQLVDKIVSAADDNGLVGYTGWPDSQTTAQAVLALLPYKDSDASAAAFISKAESTLISMQTSDGGFAYSFGDTTGNVDATGVIVAALEALGHDANGSDLMQGETGKTPVYFLVESARDDLSGYDSNWDEQMVDADAFIGLASYEAGTGNNILMLKQAMHRLYNPYSGEHFYTCDENEYQNLVAIGWNDEGIGWYAPAVSTNPVYRLYNPYTGEHHYTLSASERDMLVEAGWNDEGIGWYSLAPDDENAEPVYREYNPYEQACNHNFTASLEEHSYLVSIGWNDEGIAWYGMKVDGFSAE